MRATTPLGGQVLLLDRLTVTEGISRPFEMTLDFLSEEQSIAAKDVLKKPFGVTVDLPSGSKRYFHGLCNRFSQGSRDAEGLIAYRAEVVPWLWFLSLSSNCRIFQNKSVPDIVKAVFGDYGFTGFKLNLTGSYSPREYCVQYRESDFDFVSRLLEEEGIFYFFEHAASDHKLVLADAPSAFAAGPSPKLSAASSKAGEFGGEYIVALELENQYFTGKVSLNDYNMETPSTSLLTQMSTTVGGLQNTAFAFYDYPGKFAKKADGDRLTRIRMEEREALTKAISGRAASPGLASGFKLDVAHYYQTEANGQYVVLGVSHMASNGGYRSNDQPFTFEASFLAFPAATPYRPPRVTPKAVVRGVQTAVVVGPSGEEIYVDKYARVKVQFYWDRDGQKNEQSSCWVRGKQWGAIQIPRIGQEVIVDFLEGDPDRPIITGRVYNAEQMPPYELPANHTQSGWKSRSANKGDTATFNEFRFEDKKGSEQVFLHAEKNLDIEVEKDETHWVGQNRTKTIDKDETVHVKMNRTETVDKNETITIHGARTETVDKDETITVTDGNRSLTVKKGTETISIKGDRSTTITNGNDTHIVKMGNMTTKVQMGNVDTKIDMGNLSVKLGLGGIKEEAMQGIELKVGGNSIKIDQTGITIKGLMVKIEGQIMTEVKGMLTTVKADAILTVKGAITMIN
jgi:type VI secretion system secreted protein VgrG